MADLFINLTQDPVSVEVRRSPEVSDTFWLKVWAEWGSEGRDPRRSITVPIHVFLGNMAWFVPACRSYDVQPKPDAGIVEMLSQRQAAREQLARARQIVPLTSDEVLGRLEGGRFDRELRQFQIRDIGRMLALPHGANFSVPGAGKTAVTYAVYEAERLAGRVERLLVVSPLSAFDSWQSEAEESFSTPPVVRRLDSGNFEDAEVLLVNYHRLANEYNDVAAWVHAAPTMVVLDEAHRMKKGWSGQWGSTCLSVALIASRRDVLTGTPAPQAPSDLEALVDYLWPGQGRAVLPADAFLATPPADIGHRVATAIDPLFTRTTKPELELPAVTFSPLVLPLEGLQGQIYDALKNRLLADFNMTQSERVDLQRMGQIVMYLLEAATNPCLLPVGGAETDVFRHPPVPIPEDSSLYELIQNYAAHETPAKVIQLARLVRENAEAGRKTLVWTNFVRNIQILERQLARYQPATIYGGIPSTAEIIPGVRTRESELARFRGDDDCAVLIANPAAMSEGVSLHGVCHDAIYMDRTFNAGHYLQSLDRIHRLGLAPDQDTRVTFLITDHTIDTVVDARIRVKAERLGEMLSDPSISALALPDDEDYGTPLDTNEDIEALFAHLRGGDDEN